MRLALLALLPGSLHSLSAGADFLRAEIPARPAALAGAFAATHDDSNAFLWNPAALARVKQPLLAATHFQSIVDTVFDQASYCQPFKSKSMPGGLGVSVMHAATANLNEIDLNGNEVGAIENGDWVLHAGYGFRMNEALSFGLGLKGFNSRLDDFKSRGFAVDLGAQSQISSRVMLGASFSELGVQEAYDQQADPLPSLLRIAGRGILVDSQEVMIQLSAQLDRPWTSSDPILLNLGAEYWYQGSAAFRAGYRLGADIGNLSLGAGFRFRGLSLDYAYVSMGDIGISHRVTAGLELGTVFELAKLYVPELGDKEPDIPPPPRRIEVDPENR